MLHASAEVIAGEGEGRNRKLFCSERCQREWAKMNGRRPADPAKEAA
jgi:hypothetical protein